MAANAVLEHFYMDDLMPFAPTVDEAKETTNQLTELDDSAGSHIRKWISNEPDVIADVAEEERASDVGFLLPYVVRSKLPIPKAWLGARD